MVFFSGRIASMYTKNYFIWNRFLSVKNWFSKKNMYSILDWLKLLIRLMIIDQLIRFFLTEYCLVILSCIREILFSLSLTECKYFIEQVSYHFDKLFIDFCSFISFYYSIGQVRRLCCFTSVIRNASPDTFQSIGKNVRAHLDMFHFNLTRDPLKYWILILFFSKLVGLFNLASWWFWRCGLSLNHTMWNTDKNFVYQL